MNVRGFYGFRLRVLIAGVLATASLICTVLALTPEEKKKALDACIGKYIDDYSRCLREHPQLSPDDCRKAAAAGLAVCKKAIANIGNPPPLLPRPSAGPVKTPPPKPAPPRAPVGPIKVGSPTPTAPTIFAKPKATPTPHKDHHP